MTTLAQAQQAVILGAELDTLQQSLAILAAMEADGVSMITVTISTPSYSTTDGKHTYAGVTGPVTVPLATAQQVIVAEQTAVQAQFNALGIAA